MHGIEVVPRFLPRYIRICRVGNDAFVSMYVVCDRLADLRPVAAIHYQCPGAVRAEIEAECVLGHCLDSTFVKGAVFSAGSRTISLRLLTFSCVEAARCKG